MEKNTKPFLQPASFAIAVALMLSACTPATPPDSRIAADIIVAGDYVVTMDEFRRYMEALEAVPKIGAFSSSEEKSDFLFIVK